MASSSAGFDASDLYAFLGQFQERRSGDFYQLTGVGGALGASPAPYYAPEISLSDRGAPSLPRTERDAMSLATSATPRSAMFDGFDSYSVYSTSTAPPRRGHEPLHRQRPTVAEGPMSWLPCEFRKLYLCGENFALDDVEHWIEHIITQHLKWNLPRYSICWFCDRARFPAASDHQEEKEKAFRRRMHHIAGHFRSGQRALDIRPDFHFLDHLHEQYLIEEHVFQRAKRQSELRLPRGLTLAYNAPAGSSRGEDHVERRPVYARGRDGTRW